MSNFSYTASSSFSSSMSSSNGQTRSYSQITHSDPSGTKVHRTIQEPGEARRVERVEYDANGRRIGSEDGRGRIEDVTDKEDAEREKTEEEKKEKKEKKYLANMEDEYAKREGGA
ncbi:hypothetical protein K504DRAFT_467241 [Pleomassaria siparia CBS 279.74]|uniref:Uncharacterized protein n=1 Tax=Pleomassaria siparia CBS 279.74 TaxID=1314801 RepID=A0A6G1K9G4_9PLEO|nr:hypothetical protein K504DRAFT_467241 [Pleomassaria siparia CBS 279.74]